MARQLRIEYEGAFYHVTSSDNQRDRIFWDDNDRESSRKSLKGPRGDMHISSIPMY
jgi:hypothetical protein